MYFKIWDFLKKYFVYVFDRNYKMAVKGDLGPKIKIFFLNSSELLPDYKNAFFQGC